MNRGLVYTLLFLLIEAAVAEGQPAIWKEMKLLYPDESAVALTRNKTVTLSIVGDSLKATSDVDESILSLNDRPANANDMQIFGSHFLEVTRVEAKTRIWDKSRYKDVPLTDLARKRDDDASIFYDDSYYYHLSFPLSHAGNQAVWNFSESFRDVRFLSPFYFQSYLPLVESSLTLNIPEGVEISWQILNDSENKIQFNQTVKGGRTLYQWTVHNMPAYKLDSGSPAAAYYLPMVVYRVTQWKSKSGVKPVLSDLKDLHAWYYKTIKDIDEEPTPTVVEVAREIIAGTQNEQDAVRNIFYWVQDNVRYVAFEDGMRGLIPHTPAYVLEKRYGDCKDMASLIVGLLKAVGIKGYYTWIGTRDIPFQYSALPSPLVDNHMIAAYKDINGVFYFLDATSNHTALSMPSSMIQGKEAFVCLGADQYLVKKVPELSGSKSMKVDTVKLTVAGSTLKGEGRAYFTGYQKVFASYAFNKTDEKTQRQNAEAWTYKGSNKYVLNEYAISNVDNKDKPLRLDYTFTIADYLTYVDDELFVNLNLEKLFYNKLIPESRKAPRERDYNLADESVQQLQIPAGYQVEYLPPEIYFSNDFISFSIRYAQTASTVTAYTRVEVNDLLLMPAQFAEWNQAIKNLSNAYKESIILKKIAP